MIKKSSELVQNRSKIRVVLKSKSEIGPVRKRNVLLRCEQKRHVQFRSTFRTCGLLLVQASAFHLLSWLLSPNILEELSLFAGIFSIFRNKLLYFYFNEPQNSFLEILISVFFFFNHKLFLFRRWSMNVVDCLEIFCMHSCVFSRIKKLQILFLGCLKKS